MYSGCLMLVLNWASMMSRGSSLSGGSAPDHWINSQQIACNSDPNMNKKLQRSDVHLSEREFLSIMGDQLRALLKLYENAGTMVSRCLRGTLNQAVIMPKKYTSLISFHLLPFPVHPTGCSFCFFPGFLVIFILFLSSTTSSAHVRESVLHTEN